MSVWKGWMDVVSGLEGGVFGASEKRGGTINEGEPGTVICNTLNQSFNFSLLSCPLTRPVDMI